MSYTQPIDIMIMSGPDDGLVVRLETPKVGDTYMLGRRDDCDVILPYDSQISRQHTRLFIKDGSWHIQDLGSRNGTFLGKQKLHGMAPIQPGQMFRMGRTWLRLQRTHED